MSIFVAVAAPLWIFFIISLYPRPNRSWRGVVIPYLGGLSLGIAALVITLGLATRIPFSADFPEIYRWAWYKGPGWPLTIAVAATIAMNFRVETAYSRVRLLSCWFAGVGTVFLIWYALSPEAGFDGYRVLLSPFIWISAMAGSSWILDRGLRIDGWPRYLLYAAALLLPSILTFLPMSYALGYRILVWLLSVALAAGTTLLAFLDSRGIFK